MWQECDKKYDQKIMIIIRKQYSNEAHSKIINFQ